MLVYKLALFAHVVAVLVLFAAIGTEITAMIALRRATTVEALRAWLHGTSFLSRLLPISSVVILLSGLYMTISVWGWSTAWTDVSLVALVMLSVLGAAVNGQRIEAIHQAADRAPDGTVPAALRRQINDPVLWTSVQTMALVGIGIVYLMTVKPGWVGSLVALLVSIAIGLLSAQPYWRAAETPAVATATSTRKGR